MTSAVKGIREEKGTHKGDGFSVAVIEYLIICILVLSFNTVWTRTNSMYSYVALIKLVACMAGFIVPLIWAVKVRTIKFSMLPFVLVAGLGFCVSYFLTGNVVASLIAYLPVIMSCTYVEFCGGLHTISRFLGRFVNVVFVFATLFLFPRESRCSY